jgi:hypothetical protein
MQVGAAAQIASSVRRWHASVDSDSRQIGGDSVLGCPRALITERDPSPVTCVRQRYRLAHRPDDRRAAHSWSRMDISTSSYQRPSCSTDSRRRPSSTNPAFS